MKEINTKILEIWRKWVKKGFLKNPLLIPMLYPDLKKNVPLFVGLNPSFSIKGFKSFVDEPNFDPVKFYSWRFDLTEEHIGRIIEIELESKQKYSYFVKFREISKYVYDNDSKWEHIDLFLMRETKQKNIKRLIFKNKSNKLNEFAKNQLEIFESIINILNPNLIIVSNVLASKIFISYFKNNYFDEKFGCHVTQFTDDKIPTFFSSMLTGQRALDNFSFRRLKWHIKKVINEFS